MVVTPQMQKHAQQKQQYVVKNRELINERRKMSYHANRDAILAHRRTKRAHCSLCHFDMCNVTYLKQHLINRHKLSPEDAVRVIVG